MADVTRTGFSPRLVLGLVVIVLGVLLTLDNLDVVEIEHPLRYWPLLLIAIGLNKILGPRADRSRGWGIALLVAGVWFQLRNLDLIPFDLWDLWPLFLVFAGGALVWQALRGRERRGDSDDSAATVSAMALLSGVTRGNASQEFRGGDLTAILGACEIDLTRASIGSEEAVIDTFALWGGIEIKVPADWVVVSEVTPVLGAFEDKTRRTGAPSSKRLVVRGWAVMGGVEVRNP